MSVDSHLQHVSNLYHRYIQEVSSEVMAISDKCAFLIYKKIKEIQPKAVADLGSGFSTFVMFMATPPDVPICVLDSSRTWLARTREFCRQHVPPGLFQRPQVYWIYTNAMDPDNTEYPPPGFVADFVFFDIDMSEYRQHYLSVLSRITRPGSVICFDDMHKPCVFETVQKYSWEWKKILPPVNLTEIKDRFGRFQAMATCVA